MRVKTNSETRTYPLSSAPNLPHGKCHPRERRRELGSTFHGHHDFLLSDDIIRKVHVGHHTFYSKSIVKRPKNYVIIEDVFAQGYVGGENVQALV